MLIHITSEQAETAALKVRTETLTTVDHVRVGHGVYRLGLLDPSFRGLAAFVTELADDIANLDYAAGLVEDLDAERTRVAARLMASAVKVTGGPVKYWAVAGIAVSEDDDEQGDDGDEHPEHDDHAHDLARDRAAA